MAKRTLRDLDKESFWRSKIQEQARRGLSIRVYCRKHRLGESAFYYWRRELARRGVDGKPDATFVPVRVQPDSSAADHGSLPLAPGQIEIVLPSGHRLRVTVPVDRQALAEVLTVLEGVSC